MAVTNPGGAGFPPAIASVESYGHSWPDWFGNTNRKYSYPFRVAKALGCSLTNVAQSGADFADSDYYGGVSRIMRHPYLAPEATAGPYVAKGGLKITHAPSNDGTVHGTGANASAMVERGFTTALAALNAARYISPGSGSLTLSGMSSLADLTATINGNYLYCTVNGSYVQVAIDAKYNSEGICIVLPNYALFPCTATATVTRDPTGANVTVATYSAGVADNAVLAASVRNAPLGLWIPAGTLPVGANTLRITYTGLSGPNYGTFAGVIICGNAPVCVLKYPRRNPDSVIAGGTAVDTLFQWGNARATNVMAQFPNAFAVETDSALAPNWTGSSGVGPSADESNYWFDNAHPNDNGAGRIASNILRALPTAVSIAQSGAMNEVPISPPGPPVSPKDAVRAASTTNMSLAPGGTTLTVDTVAINQDDRLLLKDQTNPAQNGPYVARGVGLNVTLRRADDASASSLMGGGHTIQVAEGSQAGTKWQSVSPSVVTLDTTLIYYTRTFPTHLPKAYKAAWNPTAASLLENGSRDSFTGTLALTTATTYCLGGLVAPAGRLLSSVSLWATVAGTLTGRWVALVRQSDLSVLAVSANVGSGFNANAITTQAFASAYTPIVDTPVYLCVGTVSSAAPTLIATPAGNATFMAQPPILVGTSATAATTTPPSVAATLGALTAVAQTPWVALS